MKRPSGINVIAIIIIVLYSLSLLGGLIGAAMLLSRPAVLEAATGISSGYYVISAIFGIIISALFITLAANILRSKEWARRALIYLVIIAIAIGLISLFVPNSRGTVSLGASIFSWVVSGGLWLAIVYYFTRPKVKKVFK